MEHYFNSSTDTSSCFEINNVHVNDLYLNSHYVCYPNPTSGVCSVLFNQHYENLIVTLYNFEGKMIRKYGFLNTNMIECDLKNDPAGLYFLKVDSELGSTSIQEIKL